MGSSSISGRFFRSDAGMGIYEAEAMNGRIAKKIRKAVKKNWQELYGYILEEPFRRRLAIALFLVTHSKKVRK